MVGNRGIEHKNISSILMAFDHFDMPNFAIFDGRGKDICDQCTAGNKELAADRLSNWLEAIEANGTTALYMLKVYGPDVDGQLINNKTPSTGSTTFQLNQYQPAGVGNTNTPGVVMVGNGGNNNTAIVEMMRQMQEQNNKLLQTFQAQIMAKEKSETKELLEFLMKQNQERENSGNPWDKLIGSITENPAIVTDVIGKIAGIFTKQPAAPAVPVPETYHTINYSPISGTNHTEDVTLMQQTQQQPPAAEQDELPVINVLTDSQLEELTQLQIQTDGSQHQDLQNEALEVIEHRIGTATLTKLLQKVATCPDKQISMILSFIA